MPMPTNIRAMSQLSDASQRLKDWIRKPALWLFNDELMTVLAFLIIPVVGLPMLFAFSETMLAIFDLINYFIIVMFVAEYFTLLYLSDSRVKYAKDPWHILDLLIIVLAALEFVPFISFPGGRASPVLRLLRVLRIFTALGRSAKSGKQETPLQVTPIQVSRMKVNILDRDGVRRCVSNDHKCNIADTRGPAWIDIVDFSTIDLDQVSAAIHVPKIVLESKISQEAFPRIDYFKDYTTIFTWNVRLVSDGAGYRDMKVLFNGMLIVCSGDLIITICTGENLLFDEFIADGSIGMGDDFTTNVLYSLLKRKVHDGEDIIRSIERKTVRLEQLPVGKTPSSFLEDTFHLRKDVLIISKNLWHLRQVLDSLKSRKVALNDMKDEHLHLFDILYDEADYLYETVDNLAESLSSLRELHINTISYEMTRVMRILAVITCIALVPSTIGGLLGENLIGIPFPIHIGEVILIVISLMVLELYAFYKMGWLR